MRPGTFSPPFFFAVAGRGPFAESAACQSRRAASGRPLVGARRGGRRTLAGLTGTSGLGPPAIARGRVAEGVPPAHCQAPGPIGTQKRTSPMTCCSRHTSSGRAAWGLGHCGGIVAAGRVGNMVPDIDSGVWAASHLVRSVQLGGVEPVFKKLIAAFAAASLAGATPAIAQSSPPVKMSTSGICHPKGGTYYDRTKNFTPYKSMSACVAAGGRPPKR